MGLFDRIFGTKAQPVMNAEVWKTLTAYRPMFTNYAGSVYESELVRSAINARATACSKLSVNINGAGRPKLTIKLRQAPNEFMTWGQFLYRLSTILDAQNTAFIVPVFDEYDQVTGVFPVLPDRCEVVSYNGSPYLRYTFQTGEKASVEMALCGVMTKFQYRDDLFGESNRALLPTMELINIQNQGISEGVKSAATYRFMAQLSNFAKPADVANERRRFSEENFEKEDGGGLLLFPNTYSNIQQIKSTPFVVDANQMGIIKSNVFNYFGVNEDVLQNKAYGDAWSAFYEGAVEPFAIQLSDVLTRMLFSLNERNRGNYIQFSSSRVQYMSNSDKLNVCKELLDRGILTINQAREIWQLPPVEDGDIRIIRGEYYNAETKEGMNDDGTSDEEA